MFSTFSTRWRCVRSNFTEEGVFCWWFHESVWGYRFIWWIKEGINVFHCWCAFSIQYFKSNLKNILPYLKHYFYFLPCMHPSNPPFSLFFVNTILSSLFYIVRKWYWVSYKKLISVNMYLWGRKFDAWVCFCLVFYPLTFPNLLPLPFTPGPIGDW